MNRIDWLLATGGNPCFVAELAPLLAAALPDALGFAAPALVGAAEGAGGGALLGSLTGSGAGKGALFGGITGGAVAGLGPTLGSVGEAAGLPAGIAGTAGDVAAGVGAGLAGSAITGQPLSTGAIEGGAAGALSGLTGGSSPAPGANAVPGAGGAGASASGASAALPAGDITAPGSLDLATSAGAGPAGTPPIGGNGSFFMGGMTTPGADGATLPPDMSNFAPTGNPPQFSEASLFNPANPNALAVPGGPTAGAGGGGGGFDLSTLTSNPALLLGGGVLAMDAIRQSQPLPEEAQLNKIGAQEAATGKQLSSYLASGTLPPGAQESVNLATNAAKAQVRATAAKLGLSGSTWEADRMGQIDQQAAAQSEQIATQLLQQGANFTGLSTSVFENLMRSTLSEDQAFQSALSQFAGGLAGARLNQGSGG